MDALLGALTPLFNLLLVVIGFGLVVFIHELGHFVTARWAGIRVFAFALGFGPAVLSYRKGIGLRRGSSEPEYIKLIDQAKNGDADARAEATRVLEGGVSSTEYRLNALPFGGYVKMLGQHDLHPDTTVVAPDSYLAKPIWKRMIVISGGVVMNIILAVAVFVGVFMIGLETEPAKIGVVYAGDPASKAVASNAEELGVTETGLQPGDVVLEINGKKPQRFDSILMAAAMTGPGDTVDLLVQRGGIDEPLLFEITPERSQFTNMLEIGVEPPRTATLPDLPPSAAEVWAELRERAGLAGVEPGMRMTRAGDITTIEGAEALRQAASDSGGLPFEVEFTSDDGRTVTIEVQPRAELMMDDANPDPMVVAPLDHLLGLTPVMTVGPLGESDRGYAQGLREGDVFARIGEVEYPGTASGTSEIRRHAGEDLDIAVLRSDPETGEASEIELTVSVGKDGRVGFLPSDTADDSTLLSLPPRTLVPIRQGSEPFRPAAVTRVTSPGATLLSINGDPVSNFTEIREALRRHVTLEVALDHGETSVNLELLLPHGDQPDGSATVRTVMLPINYYEAERLHELGWNPPFTTRLFEPEVFLLKAESPIDAVGMGVRRTHEMMVMTYLTIARLVQGTVQVDNLKGPVGIAHLGTQVASRGYIWLIFFLGLISVNLAVVNFLPLPIADGGQFLMLLYEQIRGKPLPIQVQNAITAVGLLMFVSLFLVITFNDVARLFGG